MKNYALFFGLLLAGAASASTVQYAGHSGRLQNLTATPNAELEIKVELSECGSSWIPGNGNWCEVKQQTTSKIDSLGYFKIRPARIHVGSSNWGSIRAVLRKKDSPSSDSLEEIKMEILDAGKGLTVFGYPTHPIEFETTDGRTLTEWNSTDFGPGRVTMTRIFKDLAGKELLRVSPSYPTTTSETHLTMPDDLLIIPGFIERGSAINLVYSISPDGRSGEGVILSAESLTLKAETPQASALPTKITLDTKVMNYAIGGSYKNVTIDLLGTSIIGDRASFSCKSGILNGEMDIQGTTVSVTGACSPGKAEFYLETRFYHRNFKGTVRFDKIVNRSVCGEMTDIMDNHFGKLCFIRME